MEISRRVMNRMARPVGSSGRGNEAVNRLSIEPDNSTDGTRHRAVMHQNATFTAKRRGIPRKASPAFAMNLGTGNWRN